MLATPVKYTMGIYHISQNSKKFLYLTAEDAKSMNEIEDVAGKMNKLVSIIEIPPEQLKTRQKECAELRELLRKYYPDCMLLTFGSTVNGFGLKYSDLDLLFLPFPSYCNVDFVPKDKDQKLALPDPEAILSGETSKDVLTKLDELSHLLFIKSILKKEKQLVQKHYVIPSKHTPTLRAFLANSKLICDLAASNRLVVYNSELLEFYRMYDHRVRPLAMTLRYWAHSLGLMRKNYFSCYAFTLMVIFFLQNTNPPILMPAQRLIKFAGFSRVIAGWQTAINLIPPPKSENQETLEDLLLHFFQFYWNFDFSQNIISVHHGKVMPIKELKNSSDKRMEDFLIAAVNVQDPFVLNRNCCKKEGSQAALKVALFTAYQILQDKTGKFKFPMLFDANVYEKIFSLHFDRYTLGNEKVFLINMDYEIRNSLNQRNNSESWYQLVSQAVFDVLQYGLLMDCEVIDQMPWAVQRMQNNMETNGASVMNLIDVSSVRDSPFELQLLISLQCYVYTRVWIGRKQLTEVTESTEDEFEDFSHPVLKSEYNLSKALIKSNPVIDSPQPLLCFKCECFKHGSPQISDIVVILKPLVSSKEFHTVFAFLQSYITKTVKKMITTA